MSVDRIDNLTALLNGFKRRTKGNLCLTIAYVPAYKTIHDLGALHIFLGILNCSKLILCFLIRKHLLKLPLQKYAGSETARPPKLNRLGEIGRAHV